MKALNQIFLLQAFVIAIASTALAQNELLGKWTVKCPLESYKNTLLFNGICHYEYSEEKSSICVNELEMTFTDNELHINRRDTLTKINYDHNKKNHTLKFNFKNEDYHYNILDGGIENAIILKSTDGSLVILKRKK